MYLYIGDPDVICMTVGAIRVKVISPSKGITFLETSFRVPACDAGGPGLIPGGGKLKPNVCPPGCSPKGWPWSSLSLSLYIFILPFLQEKMGEGETVVGEEGVYTGDPPRLPHHNLNKIQNR